MKLKKADVKDLLKVTFPEYKGRKFRLAVYREYQLSNYWDGGSKEETLAVKWNGERWESAPMPQATTNPHNPVAHTTVTLPKDVMLIIHQYYCGTDQGVVIVASPDCEYVTKRLEAA